MQLPNRPQRTLRTLTLVLASFVVALLALSLSPYAIAAPATPSAGTAATLSSAVPAVPTSALQANLDTAAPGSTIHIPAGTFVGQFRIHRDLTLVGAGEGRTILQSPPTMAPDFLGNVFVVEVNNRATVSISDLSVQVTEQCMLANSIGVATGGGIGVGGDATLHVWDVRAVASGPAPDLNKACTSANGSPGMYSFGRAVSIGLDDPPGVGTNHQVEGHGTISNVVARGFDIFSLSVGGVRGPSGSTATITNNVVRVGPGPYTAAYGIVVYGNSTISNNLVTGEAGSDGGIAVVDASAWVTDNTVRNFTCLTAPFPITPVCGVDPIYDDQDLGIFLADITPGTVVEHNTIERVDAGMLIEGPGAPALVEHNRIASSTYYALDVIDATQLFRDNALIGGLYAVAVAAEASNSTALLAHDTVRGDSTGLALLEAIYPYTAKVVVV
jgi:hypothetical protein